jgi:signal transduction histidine kinase
VDRPPDVAPPPTDRDARHDLEDLRALLGAVAHDLRTPIAAILGLALTLEDPAVVDDEARDLAGRIAANARRLDRLLNDLLDLDRLARGVAEPAQWPVDVGALLERVVDESGASGERDVTVEAERLVAEVDASKVERILETLVANAVRHTPPGSRIWASARPERDGVLLLVEDDGPGVPPEQREAIFDPVRREVLPDRAAGAGLGLVLVTRFAALHGGRAWVQDREGGGASFRVWLPVQSARLEGAVPD